MDNATIVIVVVCAFVGAYIIVGLVRYRLDLGFFLNRIMVRKQLRRSDKKTISLHNVGNPERVELTIDEMESIIDDLITSVSASITMFMLIAIQQVLHSEQQNDGDMESQQNEGLLPLSDNGTRERYLAKIANDVFYSDNEFADVLPPNRISTFESI